MRRTSTVELIVDEEAENRLKLLCIDGKVRQAVEWLYSAGVSIIKVGYPKSIAQHNGNFNNVHVWTYGYLLKRIGEVAEEYGIAVFHVDEASTSSKCPLHGEGCGRRIEGLFKCKKLNKVFKADLVASYNILITPSPADRGNGPETWPGIEPLRGDVIPKLPALAGTSRPLGWGGGQSSSSENEVKMLDEFALKKLGLKVGKRVKWDDLRNKIQEIIGEWRDFACKNCDWRGACNV